MCPWAVMTCWRTRGRPLGREAEVAQPITLPALEHHTVGIRRHSSSRSNPLDTSTLPCTTRARTVRSGPSAAAVVLNGAGAVGEART